MKKMEKGTELNRQKQIQKGEQEANKRREWGIEKHGQRNKQREIGTDRWSNKETA